MTTDKYKIIALRYYLKYQLGLLPALTQTSVAERACLIKYAQNKRRIAEIGVFHGVNTKNFRQNMAEDGVILAIDPYDRSFGSLLGFGWIRRIAHQEVAKVDRGQIVWIETLGYLAASHPDARPYLPIDFLFIDGDHSWEGIRGDWEAWQPHIASGGIVALHDSINSGQAGSERFTQEVILNDKRFALLETVNTLTVLSRY